MATPTLVNSSYVGGTTAVEALGFTPTSGNLLIALYTVRSRTWSDVTTVLVTNGYAGEAYTPIVDYSAWNRPVSAQYRVSDGTETHTFRDVNGSAGADLIMLEISGNTAGMLSAVNGAISGTTTPTGPAVVPTDAALVIGFFVQEGDTPSSARVLGAGTGWAVVEEENPERWAPHPVVVSKTVSAGSVSPLATSDTGQAWSAISLSFEDATPPTPPPDPEPDVVLDPPGEIDADPVPITGDIMSWVIRRGSGAEVTGAAEPGSATVRLRNTSDAYNPENSSSPLIDYLRDGTAIWLGVNNDGLMTGTEPRGLFGGRITDISVLPMAGPDDAPVVEFQCEDALGWYGRTPVYVAYEAGRSHGELRQRVLLEAGETRTALANEIMTMPLSGAEGNALTVLDNINRANGTRHFIKPADDPLDWYHYTTYNRQHGLSGASNATLAGTDIHAGSGVSWRLAVDTVINAQRAVVTPVRFTPNTYTVWEAETLPIIVTPDRPYTVWVEFDDYVQGATLDVTRTGDSPTTETLEEFGTRAKITLAQTGVGDTTTYTGLTVQGSLARRLPDESWLANDTTSQAPPRGIRQGSDIRGEYVGTLAGARGIAEHVVWRYGNPQTRPTLSVVNWFPEMFDIDLGDIISVTFAEVSATSQLFEVVGLTHRAHFITPTRSMHQTDYVLQKCRVQSDPGWFILDDSLLDGADILAY